MEEPHRGGLGRLVRAGCVLPAGQRAARVHGRARPRAAEGPGPAPEAAARRRGLAGARHARGRGRARARAVPHQRHRVHAGARVAGREGRYGRRHRRLVRGAGRQARAGAIPVAGRAGRRRPGVERRRRAPPDARARRRADDSPRAAVRPARPHGARRHARAGARRARRARRSGRRRACARRHRSHRRGGPLPDAGPVGRARALRRRGRHLRPHRRRHQRPRHGQRQRAAAGPRQALRHRHRTGPARRAGRHRRRHRPARRPHRRARGDARPGAGRGRLVRRPRLRADQDLFLVPSPTWRMRAACA